MTQEQQHAKIDGFWPGYLESEVRPLDEQECRYFLHFSLFANRPMPEEMLNDLRKIISFSVIERRLAVFDKDGDLKSDEIELNKQWNDEAGGVDIDPFCYLWCALLCRNPAEAVMWAYTLYLLWRRTGQRVTLQTWTEAFPNGVPTDAAKKQLWESQKQTSPDYPENYMDDLRRWPKKVPEDSGILAARERTAAQQLEFAQQTALGVLDNEKDAGKAFACFASELRKHRETKQHPWIELGMFSMMAGMAKDAEAMRDFIASAKPESTDSAN